MLEELRAELVRCAKEAEAQGLCRHRSGNFSARDPATGLICMTPSGVDRRTMCAEDIVVMTPAAEVVEAREGLKPTSEALMHLAAYEERADIRAVAHTHSPFALVFAVLGRPIPPVVLEAAHLHTADGVVPVAPFAPQGTKALADSVRGPLRTGDALLLGQHGALAVGATPDEALLRAAYLEEIAEVYYRTLLLTNGAEPPRLSPEALTLRYPRLRTANESTAPDTVNENRHCRNDKERFG